MPSFSGGQGAFTPATGNDNWTLDALTTAVASIKVTMISWGGSNSSSNGYRTRWTRASTLGVGAGTAITTQPDNPSYAASAASLFSTYATTQPVLPADPNNLFAIDWNNQGGSGVIIHPLQQPWYAIANGGVNKQEINCRNTKGTDASLSSYTLTWMED